MSLYNPGDVVYVKSTEEPVTVMAIRPAVEDEFDGQKFPRGFTGDKEVIVVRRPVMTEAQGIRYAFFDFLACELESQGEQNARLFSRLMARKELAEAELGEVIGVQAAPKQAKPH